VRVEADKAKIAAADAIRERNLKAEEAEGEALLRERNRNPADRLTMKAMTWSLGGFKSVGIVNVTIENNDFAVKDVGIPMIDRYSPLAGSGPSSRPTVAPSRSRSRGRISSMAS
jgi:hypothetical protein